MAKMDDDILRSFIEHQESRAARPETAEEQARAMDYYLGKPLGNEEEGRSSVISSDVWDVVEGLAPLVLKPFVSSDDVVRFNAQGPEDEDAASQETDYINYVVTQKNDVFEQLVAWVKMGLLQKNGVVKYWWEESRRVQIESYDDISDDVYHLLIQDPSVTVLEHTEHQGEAMAGPNGQPMPGEPTHDVKVRILNKEGCAKYAVIPPEELLISVDTRSPNPKNAPFIQHRTRKTISALREMGYDVPDDISDAGSNSNADAEPQAVSRQRNGEMRTDFDGAGDPSQREVWYRESYTFVDFDGDGMAEARKVCMVGDTVLENEEVEEWPFAGWTPYQQLFQFDGRCPADETIEIQEVKSTLWRQSLDNIYTINNNRTYVSDKVNLDDMLDNQIAGIVRVSGDVVGNHAMSMPITPIGGVIQPMIEYMDSAKENRTGFTRYNQGTDANSLNKTATGVRIIAEAGNERVGLVSRSFAEQGLKPLMLGIHGLCRRHSTKAETLRLRGKWVTIDPRSWVNRYDMTVSVGLGTSDKQMQLQGHQMLMAEQKQLAQVPGLVKPENFFNAAAKMSEILGEKDPGKYFSDPAKQEPQQPPDPTQDPSFQLEAKKVSQKDDEIALKSREVDIKDRDSMVNAEAKEAELALKAEMQGHDMQLQLMQAMQSMEQTMQDMRLSMEQMQMQAQGQAHSQQMAEHGAMLNEQGQAQEMTEQPEVPDGQV